MSDEMYDYLAPGHPTGYPALEEFFRANSQARSLMGDLRKLGDTLSAMEVRTGHVVSRLNDPNAGIKKATAEIATLQRQRDSLIREARRQKARADKAEKVQSRLVAGKTPVEALRYSHTKLLEVSNDPRVGGIAMLIRLVAEDLEKLEGSQK
ncbi:hypothetical protein ACFQ6C_26275 [Streptomyces sp. NPDC056454]|uniref:hypothetical protein n=1 Tax=Streptomyces sp. NPDC056454 TaxID=3345823 RepID=UPI0036B49CFB